MKLRKHMLVGATLGAATLAPSVAFAVPHAASVGTPPHVVAAIIVGLLLLAGFVVLMLRTFRNMQATKEVSRVDEVRHDVDDLMDAWNDSPSVDVLHSLVDGLRESSTEDEAQLFSEALTQASGRYFGTDDVAWEVWVRREAKSHVAAMAPRDRTAPPAGEVLPVS